MIDASEDNENDMMSNKRMKNKMMYGTPTSETLFHRLGGVGVVRTAVEEFYTRLLNDTELSPFFDNTKMVILKQHQLEFFKLALTEIPPDLDVGALLLEKHDALFATGLNENHFDLVANHFVATLSHLGVCADMIDEAAGVILPLRTVFEQGALKYADKIAAEKEKTNNKEPTTTSSASGESSAAATKAESAPATTVLHAAQQHNEANLHDKLGGVAALKTVVEAFYKRLLEDPELSPFFEDVNMTALKLHQVQFMKIAFSQIPEDMDVAALMRQKHASLFNKGLNEKHFDLVVKHFGATLQAANIEESVVAEAVAVIIPLRVVFEQGAAAAAMEQQHAAASSLAALA